jgi:hypothetical protein
MPQTRLILGCAPTLSSTACQVLRETHEKRVRRGLESMAKLRHEVPGAQLIGRNDFESELGEDQVNVAPALPLQESKQGLDQLDTLTW